MPDCDHEWQEVYYGTKCMRCGLFYPNTYSDDEDDEAAPDMMAGVFDPYLGEDE